MAISVISISSNSSEESVGAFTARVILFGTIPTTIPSTVPTVDSPTIPHIAPTIQYTSSFVCTDSSDVTLLIHHRHKIRMRLSHKRHRSPTTLVPIASSVPRALSPVRFDLLPPRKRIKDYDFMIDPDETESSARGTIEIGVDRVTHLVVSDDATKPVREDYPDLICADGSLEVMQRGIDMVMQELYDHIVEIQCAAMSEMISTLERDNMRLRGITMLTATHFGMAQAAINKLIAKYVAEALEAYGAARNPVTKTKMENEQQDDNVEDNVNNGNSNGNGNGHPNVNNKGVVPVAREFTYQDFLKCQPLNLKGTEGVVGLTRWFMKIEMVFHIRLVKLTTERFQELTLLYTKMVPNEEDRVKKYIGGLLANIQGNVIAAELTRLHDASCIANNSID
nr:hypothetical protein [Tanacetum cinerariifolium]